MVYYLLHYLPLAGILNLVEAGVHAITSAFTIIPQPAMDAAAPSGIPYVHGNTSSVNVELYQGDPEKYKNNILIKK